MSIEKISSASPQGPPNLQGRVNSYRDTGITFADLIRDKVQPGELKISAHAANRIKSRGIEMNDEIKGKLNSAMSDIAAKGGRDALVLLNDSAFIVNVPNRTIVTAMDSENLTSNVFTNIDSATIIE